jgi:hypothetical protein
VWNAAHAKLGITFKNVAEQPPEKILFVITDKVQENVRASIIINK